MPRTERDRALSDTELLSLARSNRRQLLEAAEGLAVLVRELRRRLNQHRADGRPFDDDCIGVLEQRLEHLRAQAYAADDEEPE